MVWGLGALPRDRSLIRLCPREWRHWGSNLENQPTLRPTALRQTRQSLAGGRGEVSVRWSWDADRCLGALPLSYGQPSVARKRIELFDHPVMSG